MKALIVSGGAPPTKKLLDTYIDDCDLIIGADKGCEALIKSEYIPNYILGDFDSATEDTINKLESGGAIKFKFKEEKDFTDTESAFDLAVNNGATEIILLGATGTRYDHVLGNLGLVLKGLNLGIKVQIVDDNNRIFMINKNTTLYGEVGQIVSFQSYCNVVKKLNISGAKYELKDYDLMLGNSLTVSNEFIGKPINISFTSGVLMVLYTKD